MELQNYENFFILCCYNWHSRRTITTKRFVSLVGSFNILIVIGGEKKWIKTLIN